jgi:peroxiredoxin
MLLCIRKSKIENDLGRSEMRFPSFQKLVWTVFLFFSCGGGDKETARRFDFTPSPAQVEEVDVTTLAVGSRAPDFHLPAADGRYYTLADFNEAKVLVVIFTCNHCPTAQAYEERIIRFTEEYKALGVAVVAISPNSVLGLLYEECGYSDLGDSFEDMMLRAEHRRFNFPYLYDGDTQQVSIQYGPVATPHAFVFDQNRILRYNGRLDSSEKPGTAEAEDLRGAVVSVLNGTEPPQPTTKSFGCSIKWAWKSNWKRTVDAQWEDAPVELQSIDEKGIDELLKNDSPKLRLLNLWATWCGPCVIEYPELVNIHRMYKGRDFEFISISADDPGNRERVLRFLTEKHSALTNYIFDKEDKYALVEAVDSEWDGALPYTLLVEPGGKIVYRCQGPVEPLELKRAIVDHPMIGRYY